MWRLISSGSKSVVALPSSTRPNRFIAPDLKRSASANEVFPAPPCEKRPTSTMLGASYAFIVSSLLEDRRVVWAAGLRKDRGGKRRYYSKGPSRSPASVAGI